MNEWNSRFTRLEDITSEVTGTWPVVLISFIIVLIWLLVGPLFHFSDTWQLIINTPTTILEMWLGFLIAGATNRSERALKETLQQQQQLLTLLRGEEGEVIDIDHDIHSLLTQNNEMTAAIHLLTKTIHTQTTTLVTAQREHNDRSTST